MYCKFLGHISVTEAEWQARLMSVGEAVQRKKNGTLDLIKFRCQFIVLGNFWWDYPGNTFKYYPKCTKSPVFY